MKKADIVIGGVYSTGKDRVWKVIAEGKQPEFSWSAKQVDSVCYEVIQDGTKENRTCGEQNTISRESFAGWAVERIE